MKLSIALPGLFWHKSSKLSWQESQYTNLNYLIRRGTVHKTDNNLSDFLYSTDNKDENTSIANIIAKKLGHESKHKYFLLAEPTFLRADRDRLLICESELLQLDDTEAEDIISKINSHFDGIITLYKVNTNIYLVGLNLDISDNKFYPILDIIGENIDEYLPKGNNSIELTKIINEIQMLLFNLELNRLRKNEGLIQVNSLWLWDKKNQTDLINQYSSIFTNINTINNAKIERIPDVISDAFTNNSLIIIDSLYYPYCYFDSHSYVNNLSILNQQLFAVIIANWHKIDHLEILVPGINDTIVITLTKNDKYKFWRKLSLLQLLKE